MAFKSRLLIGWVMRCRTGKGEGAVQSGLQLCSLPGSLSHLPFCRQEPQAVGKGPRPLLPSQQSQEEVLSQKLSVNFLSMSHWPVPKPIFRPVFQSHLLARVGIYSNWNSEEISFSLRTLAEKGRCKNKNEG